MLAAQHHGFCCRMPNPVGAWLASDDGLPATQNLADAPHPPVGAGLLAKTVHQPKHMLADPPLSRASLIVAPPLPQVLSRTHIQRTTPSPVGASLLAMVVQATRGVRQPSSSLTSIASMLAPTEKHASPRSGRLEGRLASLLMLRCPVGRTGRQGMEPLVTLGTKVTRRQGGTLSGRDRSNGYVHPTQSHRLQASSHRFCGVRKSNGQPQPL